MQVCQDVIGVLAQSELDLGPADEVIDEGSIAQQIDAVMDIVDGTILPRVLEFRCGSEHLLIFAARGQILKIENGSDSPSGNPLTLYWALEDFVTSGEKINVSQNVIPFSALVKLKGCSPEDIRNAPNQKPVEFDDDEEELLDAKEA